MVDTPTMSEDGDDRQEPEEPRESGTMEEHPHERYRPDEVEGPPSPDGQPAEERGPGDQQPGQQGQPSPGDQPSPTGRPASGSQGESRLGREGQSEPGGQNQPASGDRGQPENGEQGEPASSDRGQPAPGGQTQPAPAGQGQPAGQPGQPVQQGPSLVDRLQQPHVLDELKLFVGTFGALGVGFGLTGLVTVPMATATEAAATAGVTSIWLFGVGLAALLSTRFAERVDEDRATSAVGAAVGSGLGVLVLGLVAGVLVAIAAGPYTLELGYVVLGSLVVAFPAALVGGALAYLARSV